MKPKIICSICTFNGFSIFIQTESQENLSQWRKLALEKKMRWVFCLNNVGWRQLVKNSSFVSLHQSLKHLSCFSYRSRVYEGSALGMILCQNDWCAAHRLYKVHKIWCCESRVIRSLWQIIDNFIAGKVYFNYCIFCNHRPMNARKRKQLNNKFFVDFL